MAISSLYWSYMQFCYQPAEGSQETIQYNTIQNMYFSDSDLCWEAWEKENLVVYDSYMSVHQDYIELWVCNTQHFYIKLI